MGPSPGPLRAVPLGGGPASIAALLPEQPDYQTCWRRPTSRIPLSTTRREAPASAAIEPQSDAMTNSVNPAKMRFTASEKPKIWRLTVSVFQIGRASGRKRGCQYCLLAVVD